MFAIDDQLISDAVLNAPFACNLARCRGACCVQGESGAPLESEERFILEELVPQVRSYLRPEALEVMEAYGVWEEIEPGQYATRCVDDGACVFVHYDGSVAKCAVQIVYQQSTIDFPKPISCHLYPIRIEKIGDHEVLNYEQMSMCDAAREQGRRHHLQLISMLREPLIRKYGTSWYERFLIACEARTQTLNLMAGR